VNKLNIPMAAGWLPALALLVAATGCSITERSRELGNPAVPGVATAQQVCSTCHGVDGNSTSPQFPKLAGQQKDYLVSQLKNFRGHDRLDPPGPEYMWGLSHNLSDEQVEAIAEYFNAQPPMRPNGTNSEAVGAGMQIYRQGIPEKEVPPCQSCHGPDGQGLAGFPRLAGQHANYVLRQLHVFQETNFRPGTPMAQVTHLLTAEQMKDVALFLQAFPAAQ